jgi:DNA-binding NtrC family response regulator
MEEGDAAGLMPLWTARDPATAFVILDVGADWTHAKCAIRAGAADYFPIAERDQIVEAIRRLVQARREQAGVAASNDGAAARIIGHTAVIHDIRAKLTRAAGSDATVLLLGESGAGKGLAAEVVHAVGPRSSRPFIVANSISAFSNGPDWISELEHRLQGGTLLLDEVGDFDVQLQGRILSLLEHFERLKNTRQPPSFRLLAATNRDLQQLASQDLFRRDLLFRLSVVTLVMPPLRERAGDITLLIEHHIQELLTSRIREARWVSPEALLCLERYHWPGNVRELKNTLEGALVLAKSPVLRVEDLPDHIRNRRWTSIASKASLPSLQIDLLERQAIEKALADSENNRTHAARLLGISVRTLQRKIRQYALPETG